MLMRSHASMRGWRKWRTSTARARSVAASSPASRCGWRANTKLAWEGSTSKLFPDEGLIHRTAGDAFARQLARIECHYFVNNGFFPYDGWLLDEAKKKLQGIPTVIVQGRYDVVCPPKSAWDLKKALPHAELVVVKDAGHSASEPGIVSGLVDATNRFAGL